MATLAAPAPAPDLKDASSFLRRRLARRLIDVPRHRETGSEILDLCEELLRRAGRLPSQDPSPSPTSCPTPEPPAARPGLRSDVQPGPAAGTRLEERIQELLDRVRELEPENARLRSDLWNSDHL